MLGSEDEDEDELVAQADIGEEPLSVSVAWHWSYAGMSNVNADAANSDIL